MYFSVHLTVISWVLLKEHYGFFLLSLFNFQGPIVQLQQDFYMRFSDISHSRLSFLSTEHVLLYALLPEKSTLFLKFFQKNAKFFSVTLFSVLFCFLAQDIVGDFNTLIL